MLDAVPRQGQACVALGFTTFPDHAVLRPLQLHRRHVRENPAHPLPPLLGKTLKRDRVWSGTTPYPPSLDFGVDKIMRYGVAQFLCLQAEWAIPRPEWGQYSGSGWSGAADMEWKSWCGSGGYGVVVWEWGGGVGVGVFIMPLQSHTCSTPITHTPPLHCTPPPNPPLHPYPINPQSIKFSSQQSQGLRVNFWRLGGEWQNWSGQL